MKKHLDKKNTYSELYRPQFHFSAEKNWLNDPNGLVYFEGEYHLFYQYHPEGTQWGPMHWGHAVSSDLVHWDHLPIALYPDENGYIFSGSAVVDWQDTTGFFNGKPGLVAIFTHHDTYPDSDRVRQRQSIAYSTDKGRTWIKYSGNPVLSDESLTDFRDPKVFWHDQTRQWIMVIAVYENVHFYGSSNLKEWTFLSKFGEEHGSHGGVWECPDLFELPFRGEDQKKWVLTIGDAGNQTDWSNTQYFIGEFDGKSFTSDHSADTILWSDYGSDFYAAQSWSDVPDHDGRRIWIAWMSNFRYIAQTPTSTWRGNMSLPRELTLQRLEEGVRLVQQPIQELESLRNQHYAWNDRLITEDNDLLSDIQSNTLEIIVEFELVDENAKECGFKVRKGSNEHTVIGYDIQGHNMFIDRSQSGKIDFDTSSHFTRTYRGKLRPNNNKIKMHIFVDHSSVEVFANEGEVTFSNLIYPNQSSEDIEVYTDQGEVKIVSLDVYTLKSIWNT